mgnify:CR=1 FL=1
MSNSSGLSAAQEEHLNALAVKHASLKQKIEAEQKHPAASQAMLRRWKAEKLKLKDEIEQKKTLLT